MDEHAQRSKYQFNTSTHDNDDDETIHRLIAPSSVPSNPPGHVFYDTLVAAFVCVLLCANIMGIKVTHVVLCVVQCVDIPFGAGNVFFPFSYLFSDVTVEVYGVQRGTFSETLVLQL
jgi:hypothetical protein